MIGNRHIFVVGHQRVVGSRDLSALARVMDAREEIGVVADVRRQMQRAGSSIVQQARSTAARIAIGGKNVRQALAQCATRARRQCEQWIQLRPRRCFGRIARHTGEQPSVQSRTNVENAIADRDPATRFVAKHAEYAERQVLDGELRVAVGGRDPAQARRIMRCVDHVALPSRPQPSAHRLGEIYLP